MKYVAWCEGTETRHEAESDDDAWRMVRQLAAYATTGERRYECIVTLWRIGMEGERSIVGRQTVECGEPDGRKG